jgi:hypothetical protein
MTSAKGNNSEFSCKTVRRLLRVHMHVSVYVLVKSNRTLCLFLIVELQPYNVSVAAEVAACAALQNMPYLDKVQLLLLICLCTAFSLLSEAAMSVLDASPTPDTVLCIVGGHSACNRANVHALRLWMEQDFRCFQSGKSKLSHSFFLSGSGAQLAGL